VVRSVGPYFSREVRSGPHWSGPKIRYNPKVRSVLTEFNAHHLRSSVSRLYLPRSKGGRSLLSFEHLNELLLVDLCCYLTLSMGAYIQCVTTHEFERSTSNIFCWASEIVEAYCH